MTDRRAPPAFQCYAADLIAAKAVRLASLPERGLLFSMMLASWVDGALPSYPEDLARFLGLPHDEQFRAALTPSVLSFFALNEAKTELVCPDLERQKRELAARSRRQSEAASKGMKAYWKKQGAKPRKPSKDAGSQGDIGHICPEKRRDEKSREEKRDLKSSFNEEQTSIAARANDYLKASRG